ncbi:carbamoyltransferase HypF [Roseofilum sp. BLCC_M154]|uniref:acylphosphatase n=1 Tax=Roseofilum acuticapitatum BLCC-M154 TaxID=3022444 RepID=A0ABT7ARB7_9CYAN|nr:carbamoyltransferase HypF [Roseofilum acuticapitatum]MDJ1169453.1 carbamoyltransferase HypF [Roseofilum acuticapitatum BLCC-M154]
MKPKKTAEKTLQIRVRGRVQGVGFRPHVWRIAHELGLGGEVCNDGEGVRIRIAGEPEALSVFRQRLESEAPPLSEIESIETEALEQTVELEGFAIVESVGGKTQTQIAPDTATCGACVAEIYTPSERRYRYPFTNCTHCGPRLSIIRSVPYDRPSTTMANFPLCPDCQGEYDDPGDRRFHAQPIACPVCGPKLWLESLTEKGALGEPGKEIETVISRIEEGEILAIRGLGGFHLACDATNPEAVNRLRQRKRRYGKPFALMARDIAVIRRYCQVSAVEEETLRSGAAPIVLLNAEGGERLPEAIAPGVNTLGFMLPYTPLHLLLLEKLNYPLVMTSANLSHEPQLISNAEARTKLIGLADTVLFHNREIANRMDDSVVRVMAGKPRLLRRSRGYVPGAIALPPGFERSHTAGSSATRHNPTDPPTSPLKRGTFAAPLFKGGWGDRHAGHSSENCPKILAYGAELKSTFCLIQNNQAILSQHQGDLENPITYADYQKNLQLFQDLYDHQPQFLVADLHPEYLSTKLAQDHAQTQNLPLIQVQHHHAHIASCLVENGIPLDHPPVLGIALDGLGFGEDGTIWGGEFLLADYRGYQRLASLKPVAMIGGTQAILEPWRNTYAHLNATGDWQILSEKYGHLELFDYFQSKPIALFDQMLQKRLNTPLASSAGRLFDAVSAAMGLCRDRALFEGQGAIELEMAVDRHLLSESDADFPYPFEIIDPPTSPLKRGTFLAAPLAKGGWGDLQAKRSNSSDKLLSLDPRPMWHSLLEDLSQGATLSLIATRFHQGLIQGITHLVEKLAHQCQLDGLDIEKIALSGGCFQNRILLEELTKNLEARGYECLSQAKVPSNDGGVSLGQGAIAIARTTEST